MKRLFTMLCAGVLAMPGMRAQVTLDSCLRLAEANYPIVSKYGLVTKTKEVNLSDINKGWLPKIGVFGQANVQNSVPEFPDVLSSMLSQNGYTFEGMSHVQYKIGIDMNQSVWDGGTSSAKRRVERASSQLNKTSLDVEVYAVFERVQSLFFGILLLDEQMASIRTTAELLKANHAKMQSMVRNGVAMQSDADMIEAQLLTLNQQLTEAAGASDSYRKALSIFTGMPMESRQLVKPESAIPADQTSDRPELRLYDARISFNNMKIEAVNATLMPRVGVFAQAYYGYPGFNYFESMRNHNLSFNVMAGFNISWNADALYTSKNSRKRLRLDNASIEADRELFLFNSELQATSEKADIEALRKVMEEDDRIVALRGNVRKAAESQLDNGIIDTTDLLAKITDENQAKLNAGYHEIQLLQNIYKLKYTLNR